MSSPIITDNDDINQSAAFSNRRCCFCIPFLHGGPRPSQQSGSNSAFWQRINPLDCRSPPPDPSHSSSDHPPWWRKGWKKMREWSEIVAGPKWKTLIRRIGRKRGRHDHHNQYGRFNYDAMSYALNFDEGPAAANDHDEDLLGRGFSSRYSLPPSAKCSLDFDNDGVFFTPTVA